MITFACPNCGKTITLKDELAGRKGKCVQCGQAIVVPGEKTAESPSQVGDSKTLPPRPQPSFDRPDTLVSQVGAIAGSSGTELHDFLAPAQAADELGRLGPYRVLKVLGAGGMGVVFEAEDPMLKRKLALKAMLPSLAVSESSRKRFLREAQTAAGVEHDHIVHIYQVGEDRGVPFIAMQFLKGEPLDVRLQKSGKLPIGDVLRIGRETARGLAAAHEHGLIHRDIKPANLWLETNGDRVKILDFGLARATADNASLTQSGAIIGTPAYMAPEQANSQPVDARCDLFSLGCVLYRLSTGEMPFAGKDTLSTLMAVAMQDPTPPRETNPDVPIGLSNLIMRLLAKEPKDRPASANGVADMLAELEKSPHAKIVSAPKSSGVKYTCPVCDAIVTMSQPLPEGKKVKCPKCEAMDMMKRPDESKKTAISPRDDFKVDTEKIVRPRVTKPSSRPARPRWLIWAIAASIVGVVGIGIVVFTFRGRPPVKDGDGGGQAKGGTKSGKGATDGSRKPGKEKPPDKPPIDPEDGKKVDDPPKPVVVDPGVGNKDNPAPAIGGKIQLKQIDLTLPLPGAGPLRLAGCLPINEKLDLVWGFFPSPCVALIKPKGEVKVVWNSPELWSPEHACFDGRYAWISVRRNRQLPLLLIVDPLSEKVWQFAPGEGLPAQKPPPEMLENTGYTYMPARLSPGRVCLAGFFGQSAKPAQHDWSVWLAIAQFDPDKKLSVEIFHRANEPCNVADAQHWKNSKIGFSWGRGCVYVLTDPTDGGSRVLLVRSGVGLLSMWPLIINPEKRSVEVSSDFIYADFVKNSDVWRGTLYAVTHSGVKSRWLVRFDVGRMKKEILMDGVPLPELGSSLVVEGDRFHLISSNKWQSGSISKKELGPVETVIKDLFVSFMCRSANYGLVWVADDHKGKLTGVPFQVMFSDSSPPGKSTAKVARRTTSFTNALGIEFVLVPKGKSWLGGGGGKAREKEVEILHDFYLGKYEVTQEEWQAVTGVNPSMFSRNGQMRDAVKELSEADLKRFPVENISWDDSQLFLKKVNALAKDPDWIYRLPTEVEWEYACRGGPLTNKADSPFSFYFEKPSNQLLDHQANFEHGKGLKRTCKVGSYQPNRLGLYDMHGNVREFCADAEPVNFGASFRAHRGGAWLYDPGACSAGFRTANPPTYRTNVIGLRLARVPIGSEQK